ncbi:MAG: N-6 DNA methylase, partial [Elusimicrobiota bacterium]|nr:N-6 DNA methylase [Elusimicrobiota bacterium]
QGRLISRANKQLSEKTIMPTEYFSNLYNIEAVESLAEFIKKKKYSIVDALYTLSLKLAEQSGVLSQKCLKKNVEKLLRQYSNRKEIKELSSFTLPSGESDFLGLMYQRLKTEGGRNIRGLYFTPNKIARQLLSDLDFSAGQTFLDPACGSSNLLLNLDNANPSQLFGVDIDPVAVMISKFNLIMKYKDYDFEPQIFNFDFLKTGSLFEQNGFFESGIKFDYIITNPPWGAISLDYKNNFSEIASGEVFSYFLVSSLKYLKENALLRFLLPQSFLNIKTHSDIRAFLLENYKIEKITFYSDSFNGVVTKFIDIAVRKSKPGTAVFFSAKNKTIEVPISSWKMNSNYVFSMQSGIDLEILDLVYKRNFASLKDSVWALGIVTGNNREKLSAVWKEGWEAIWTGKEIRQYSLLPNRTFIFYNRADFQQVAKDEIYRSPQKLVYKFISDRLIFAYDDKKRLFLNSANILLPKIKGMGAKTVLLFLNSELFQFVYKQKFSDIKILRGNLSELPFAEIDGAANNEFEFLADMIFRGNNDAVAKVQNRIYSLYGIAEKYQKYIKEILNGKWKN